MDTDPGWINESVIIHSQFWKFLDGSTKIFRDPVSELDTIYYDYRYDEILVRKGESQNEIVKGKYN